MLYHLVRTPLLSMKGMLLGINTQVEALDAPDVSSFYLDDSALIRRAENPYAFLHGQEKVLSLMYLHFRYLYLMIWPVQLSPEYAFNCIPSVASLADDGNYRAVFAIVMYICIVLAALKGLWSMIALDRGQSLRNRDLYLSDHALLVSVILMVVPFIPAAGVSKVLFLAWCLLGIVLVVCVREPFHFNELLIAFIRCFFVWELCWQSVYCTSPLLVISRPLDCGAYN